MNHIYGICTDCRESHYLFDRGLCYLCTRKRLVARAQETKAPADIAAVADLDDYVGSKI